MPARAPDQVRLPGNPEISVILRRSKRAKRLSLRVSRLKGQASLSLPMAFPYHRAEQFVREKETWLRQHMAEIPNAQLIGLGSEILLRGVSAPIIRGEGKRLQFNGGQLFVPGPDEMVAARVKAYLRGQAKLALHQATDHYAALLGRSFGRITLRDTTSRWGSCSSQGNLNYSWRLIMAPPDVLNYVATHEVCHLAEMNHSPAFWAHVSRLFPGYEAQKNWLRDNGEHLHSFKFQ